MLADRRTKIVATLGPSTRDRKRLSEAIRAGMNVARLNFSHGSHQDHLNSLQTVRSLCHELDVQVAILQDLQGPKIRVGKFEGGSITMTPGEKLTVTTDEVLGKPGLIPSDFKEITKSAKPGMRILLDDGRMELKIKTVRERDLEAEVVFGGVLKDRKGINMPGANLAVDCITEKDLKDLEFGIQNGVDYIALSFVRKPDDIRRLRNLLKGRAEDVRIVAKIEMLEALDNLEEIVRLSDAVMVARGDLAVETGVTRLPAIQKRIVKLCNSLGTPVITATQMLDSMTENPTPTRAEITDVANAVIDGSDALMLSGETANGKYPIECIRTMSSIISEVEKDSHSYYNIDLGNEYFSIAESIGAAACLVALKLNASAIVCLTSTGKTATMISSFRPKARIIAATRHRNVLNKLELVWGMQTALIDQYSSSDDAMAKVEDMLVRFGLARPGDRVVLTLGVPVESGSKTNALRVFTVANENINKLPDEKLPLRYRNVLDNLG